jgi:hypothetical protein
VAEQSALRSRSTAITLFITYAQGIVKGMTGNPVFPNPVPKRATLVKLLV